MKRLTLHLTLQKSPGFFRAQISAVIHVDWTGSCSSLCIKSNNEGMRYAVPVIFFKGRLDIVPATYEV